MPWEMARAHWHPSINLFPPFNEHCMCFKPPAHIISSRVPVWCLRVTGRVCGPLLSSPSLLSQVFILEYFAYSVSSLHLVSCHTFSVSIFCTFCGTLTSCAGCGKEWGGAGPDDDAAAAESGQPWPSGESKCLWSYPGHGGCDPSLPETSRCWTEMCTRLNTHRERERQRGHGHGDRSMLGCRTKQGASFDSCRTTRTQWTHWTPRDGVAFWVHIFQPQEARKASCVSRFSKKDH